MSKKEKILQILGIILSVAWIALLVVFLMAESKGLHRFSLISWVIITIILIAMFVLSLLNPNEKKSKRE